VKRPRRSGAISIYSRGNARKGRVNLPGLHIFWLQIRHIFAEFTTRRRSPFRTRGYGRKPCAIIHWAAYASLDGPDEFVLACPCCWQLVCASSHCGGGPEALAQPARAAASSKVTQLVARIVPFTGRRERYRPSHFGPKKTNGAPWHHCGVRVDVCFWQQLTTFKTPPHIGLKARAESP
jgi:hypothetical protein